MENNLVKNELSEEEKNEKCRYARNLYNNLSEERKTKGVNTRVENIEIFLKKKKTKSVNMFVFSGKWKVVF